MLSKYLPCILLILVNLLYLFTHGVSSIRYETQLLLPNLAFFGLVTVIVFFKVSHFLYYELLPR